MIKNLFFVLWFFAPSGVANIAAFFSGKIPYLKSFSYPVDLRKKINGKRIFGDNKTIRGLIFGVISSVVAVYLQIFLYNQFDFISSFVRIDYNQVDPIIFGMLSGFGALFGDSLKSFFKRRVNVPPGKSWFPFDQIDYVIGGMVFTSFYITLSFYEYLLLFLVWFIIHPINTFLGFILKLRKEPL